MPDMTERAVTIVIPSRGLRERGQALLGAVESVRTQRGVRATPLVVLNGADRSPEVESALRRESGVRVIEREEGGIGGALHAGRDAVDTPWFGTLDDDDLLLPGALDLRLRKLQSDDRADVVVTNGIKRRAAAPDELLVTDGADVARDPLRAMLRRNWLLPGSWLARTATVHATLFDRMPRYRECTWLAFRFATEYHMHWLQEPTVVYNLGSPHAESRSRGYFLGHVAAVKQLLELSLPDDVRRHVERHVAAAYHHGADYLWSHGELADAWRFHVASLAAPGGMRFLPFTRHLVSAWYRRMLGRPIAKVS